MSGTDDAPPTGGREPQRPELRHTLEHLRDEAKRLLELARHGDPAVLARLRAALPRLASLDDAHIRETVKLADVQHALARTLAFESWGALKAHLVSRAPLHARAAQFLEAFRNDQVQRAQQLLAATPELVRHSIHTAAAAGDLDGVVAWLAADPSSATRPTRPDDTAPIIYAANSELKQQLGVSDTQQAALVRLLLEGGADANSSVPLPDGHGRIPALYFPAVANNLPVARVLLEHGANPTDGESVYHAAQHNHREMLALLASHGAELSGRHGGYGNTALYFLSTHRSSNPITPTCILGMAWLLEHGADPNVTSSIAPSGKPVPSDGETPLQRAAASGWDADALQLLVDHGASVDARRADGRSAYALAVRAGNRSGADYLERAGADTASLSPIDELLGACLTNDAESARALVAAHPALMSSLTHEDSAALGVAVTEGQEDAVALMTSLGWPLDAEGEWGGTPLHWAAWNGRLPMVRLLVAAGALVNVRDSTYGSSPIAWASHGSLHSPPRADSDYVGIVHALIDAGATRTESYNQWGEAPESMARSDVAAAFRERGFGV